MIICPTCMVTFSSKSNLPNIPTSCFTNSCVTAEYSQDYYTTINLMFFEDIINAYTNNPNITKIRFVSDDDITYSSFIHNVLTNDIKYSVLQFFKKIEYLNLLG